MTVADIRLAIADLPSNAKVRLEWASTSVDFVLRHSEVEPLHAFAANRCRELVILAHAEERENDEKLPEDGFGIDALDPRD